MLDEQTEMDATRIRRAEAVFRIVADLPSPQRDSLLRQECAGDADLRAFVEQLLSLDQTGMGEFLCHPAFTPACEPAAPVERQVPRRIGRYEIIRVIGEGGMGVVYEARQEHPQRTVALKVIRSGLPSENMLRRFEHEAEVLGQLQHPGIAHIYEAAEAELVLETGVTTRQPYFAMEFIRGAPLNDHAENMKLTTRKRLELLARVCDAVEHAHKKGVIHRDLKPANILVDALGQPKILDFGVARVTGADVRTLTAQTAAGQLIGTVPYMSPEQVAGDSSRLDTRSDVYALGVLLYELLAGSVPLDVRDLSIPEAARKIRDDQPRRLGSIDRTLRGEIETIVTRALEKEKTRRYQSASDLAADIRRYLRGEAIEAKRDSALYVLRKAVLRHRGWVAAAGLLFILLSAFGIVSFDQARKNRRLATSERAARARADATAERLATELIANNVERGRLFTRTGNLTAAEDLIWREHLRNPQSRHSYWALWELYSRNPSLATFVGHNQNLRGVSFAANGRTFVTGSLDGAIKIWNAETFELLGRLDGHSAAVYSVAYSPGNRWIASASYDGTVKVWDAATGGLVHTLRGHHGKLWAVDFAANGKRVVSGGADSEVRVWDAETGTCVRVIREHQAPISAVCYNRDLQILATGSSDGTTKLWKDLSGPSIATLTADESATSTLAFAPDGRTLAWAGRDNRVINVWHLTDPPTMETLGKPTNGTVGFLAFGPDSETLISGGSYRVDEWNLATRRRRTLIGLGAVGGAISPDGYTVVTGWEAGSIRVTDRRVNAGEIRLGGQSNVGVASISPDGRIIACGDDTNHVRLWETASGRLLARLPSPTGRWSSAHFHPSGEILATCSRDGVVRLWDLRKGTRMYTFEGVHVTTGQSLSFSPDGRSMAVTRSDETVQVRDVRTGDVRVTLPSVGSEALAVRFSPDGRIIATTHRGDTVALWTATGKRLGTLAIGIAPWTVGFSPDSSKLAVGCWGRRFQIWDIETRTLERQLGEAKMVSWGAAYMPTDTGILATCSGDGAVRLWDLREQRNILTLEPFGGSDALSVSFTPDGKTLVASGFDGSLCVWDLEYYDRHIAGNLEYQISRFREELGSSLQTEHVRSWAQDVLRRPWPRIGPHAKRSDGSKTATASHGVDPDVIAAWGHAVTESTNR